MIQEEKAKAYDRVVKEVKDFFEGRQKMYSDVEQTLEYLFPELKESEDEKIRKEIRDFIYWATDRGSITKEQLEKSNLWLDWLEKRAEPKEINPSEFDSQLNRLLGQFKSLPKEELASSLSFYLNVVQNDGTYKEEKQGEQKPAECSEEDEKILSDIIKDLVHPWNEYIPDRIEEEIKWLKNKLKSLRPQSTWKPSDEQMNALNYVVNLMASSERPTENDLYYNILKSLRQQLMKLKG